MKNNTRRLTKQFCTENNLLFLPKNHTESDEIQKKLFSLGFRWLDGDTKPFRHADILSYGLILGDCQISYPDKAVSSGAQYLLCTLKQFDEGYNGPELTQEEQISLLKKVDDLTRMFGDLSAKVDAIYKEVMPKTLNKPNLKNLKP